MTTPLVVFVVVRVVWRAGRVEDEERLNVVAQDERFGPGLVEVPAGQNVVQAGVQGSDVENGQANGHGTAPSAKFPPG